MFARGPDGSAMIVCTTCRGPGRVDGGGKALAAAIAMIAAESAYASVAVAPVNCLWSCAQGVSVQFRAPAKTGYVLGGFAAGDARDLLDFAALYAASADGEVPYDRWPDAVRGRFIARTPPPGMMFAS